MYIYVDVVIKSYAISPQTGSTFDGNIDCTKLLHFKVSLLLLLLKSKIQSHSKTSASLNIEIFRTNLNVSLVNFEKPVKQQKGENRMSRWKVCMTKVTTSAVASIMFNLRKSHTQSTDDTMPKVSFKCLSIPFRPEFPSNFFGL